MSELRRRLMMRQVGGGGGGLPSEYQQVEWLGVINENEHAYIDTGIIPYVGLNFETKSALKTHPFSSSNIIDCVIFGADEMWNAHGFSLGLNTANNFSLGTHFHMGYSTIDKHSYTGIIPDSDVFTLYKYEDGNCYINNSLVLTGNNFIPLSKDLSITIFTLNRKGTVLNARFNNIRVEFLRLYDSNGDVAHLIPCYRKSDNVAGMYDIVRQQFFTNSGSGSFIVGPVVN